VNLIRIIPAEEKRLYLIINSSSGSEGGIFLRAIIFSNGELHYPQAVLNMIRSNDLLIAADGGAVHCRDLRLTPALIIGDLDSLDDELISTFTGQGTEILQYPSRKDETDLELALLYTIEKDFDEIIIFGALGARWDMTLANVFLLAHPQVTNSMISLSDGHQNIWFIRDEETIEISGKPGDIVSLIPIQGEARGITTTNLEYPLKKGKLHFSSTRGISNVLNNTHATIHISEGSLLIIVNHSKLPA
jgi:thiamine pyrophosphokinase